MMRAWWLDIWKDGGSHGLDSVLHTLRWSLFGRFVGECECRSLKRRQVDTVRDMVRLVAADRSRGLRSRHTWRVRGVWGHDEHCPKVN